MGAPRGRGQLKIGAGHARQLLLTPGEIAGAQIGGQGVHPGELRRDHAIKLAQYIDKMFKMDYDILLSGWEIEPFDPDDYYFNCYHPKGPNFAYGGSYNNPEVTQLLESARAEQDFERRKGLYAQVQKIALADLPYWPTTSGAVFWPGYKWVTGVKINPLAQTGFYDVKVLSHG